jgi:hypothetical protein
LKTNGWQKQFIAFSILADNSRFIQGKTLANVRQTSD